MRYALLSESRERGQGREHRIAVVGAAAAVKLVAFEARDPRAITLGPADHLRLLVEMAVKQHGLGTLARHFDQDQRRAARQPYNFERRAGQSGQPIAGPALKHRDRRFHMTVRRPIRVKGRRFVRDPDVIDERRDDRIVPDLTDELAELSGIEHPNGSFRCDVMLSPAHYRGERV